MNIEKASFVYISVFYLFYFASIGVFIIFLPKLLFELQYDTYEIGLVFASVPLMRFLSPYLFVNKIVLSPTILIYSLTATSVFAFGLFFTIDEFWLFFINNIFLGFTMSLILPYMESLALESIGRENYGRSRMYGSIGFLAVAVALPHILSDQFIKQYIG